MSEEICRQKEKNEKTIVERDTLHTFTAQQLQQALQHSNTFIQGRRINKQHCILDSNCSTATLSHTVLVFCYSYQNQLKFHKVLSKNLIKKQRPVVRGTYYSLSMRVCIVKQQKHMCRCASVYVLLLDKQLSLIACVCLCVGVGGEMVLMSVLRSV